MVLRTTSEAVECPSFPQTAMNSPKLMMTVLFHSVQYSLNLYRHLATSIALFMVSWFFTKLETINSPNHSTKLVKLVFPSLNELNKIWLKNSPRFVNINHIMTFRNYFGLLNCDICLKNHKKSKACQNVWYWEESSYQLAISLASNFTGKIKSGYFVTFYNYLLTLNYY